VRTATGLNRNLFYNKQYQKEELYQLKSNPQLLNNNYFKSDSAKGQNRPSLNGYSPIYVKKWVDYSSKYGLGYLLSDGSTGIYFNDSSKMVLDDIGQYRFFNIEK
jgi:polo-like kinase 1